jgi:uncharacterized protein YcgI (DUF1989 family)
MSPSQLDGQGKVKQEPQAAYQATAGSPLFADRKLYSAIAATANSTGGRKLTESFTIPIQSGRAWTIPAGSVCRIICPEGPQVGDLDIWNQHNPKEHLWTARSRQLHSSHVTTFDRLWSNLPYLRPLVTVTAVCFYFALHSWNSLLTCLEFPGGLRRR